MSLYIGTKIVYAEPMTRAKYCEYRDWRLPEDENGLDEGYLLEEKNFRVNVQNHISHAGYISWLPKQVFDDAYESIDTGVAFGQAVELLKMGYKVARKGWNGKNMFLFLVPGSTFEVNRPPLLGIYPESTLISYQPHIDMMTAQGTVVPWLASQSDVLASDWFAVEVSTVKVQATVK
jgi:hypothetical protein